MDTLSVVLLVVIAALAVTQATFLVRLALAGRRTVRGLEQWADRLVDDLTPVAHELGRAAGNAARISEMALEEAQRVEAAVQDATDAWSRSTARLHDSFVPTFGRVATAAAAWRLLRRVYAIYRRIRR